MEKVPSSGKMRALMRVTDDDDAVFVAITGRKYQGKVGFVMSPAESCAMRVFLMHARDVKTVQTEIVCRLRGCCSALSVGSAVDVIHGSNVGRHGFVKKVLLRLQCSGGANKATNRTKSRSSKLNQLLRKSKRVSLFSPSSHCLQIATSRHVHMVGFPFFTCSILRHHCSLRFLIVFTFSLQS